MKRWFGKLLQSLMIQRRLNYKLSLLLWSKVRKWGYLVYITTSNDTVFHFLMCLHCFFQYFLVFWGNAKNIECILQMDIWHVRPLETSYCKIHAACCKCWLSYETFLNKRVEKLQSIKNLVFENNKSIRDNLRRGW